MPPTPGHTNSEGIWEELRIFIWEEHLILILAAPDLK